ncbi:MAG: hypothetical protein ACTSXZ_11700 [Alphaproteobacteria bacterium]
MNKPAVAALALLAAFTMAAFLPPGETIHVDDDAGVIQTGSKNFPFADIQQAIEAADEGAVIRIAVGYYSPFLLTKRLHLHGAGIDNVRVIHENGLPSVVTGADGAVIEGLSFVGPGTAEMPAGVGLIIENASGVLVLSCKFPYFETGIDLRGSEVTLAAGILEYSEIGAFVDADSTLHASANLIVNNEVGVDCAGGEMESCDDLIDGNGIGVAESCVTPGF